MRRRDYETCAQCDRTIARGDEFYMADRTGERMFCSTECMREWLKESAELDSVIDDWIEDNAECYDLESDDPYDLYGVSEGDFA